MLDKAASAAAGEDLAAERARIHHLRGNLCFPLGRLDECLQEHRRALDCARKPVRRRWRRALGGLGDAEYARGRMASAHRHFSRCVELSRASGAGRIEVANLSMVAHTEVYLNDFSGALATVQAAVELAERVGHHRAEIIAHNAACNVFRTTGELDVQGRMPSGRWLARQLGAKRFEAVGLNDLPWSLAQRRTGGGDGPAAPGPGDQPRDRAQLQRGSSATLRSRPRIRSSVARRWRKARRSCAKAR